MLTASPPLRAIGFKGPESLIFFALNFNLLPSTMGTRLSVCQDKMSAFTSSSVCMSLNFFLSRARKNPKTLKIMSLQQPRLALQFTETTLRLSWACVNLPLSAARLISQFFLNIFSFLLDLRKSLIYLCSHSDTLLPPKDEILESGTAN